MSAETSTLRAQNTSPLNFAEWDARATAHHQEEVTQGLHDDACEYGHRDARGATLRLCHCSKRRREREGFTTPPEEDLEWQMPLCPRCREEVVHDGDRFCCYGCCLSWNEKGAGTSATFIDDYGVLTLEGGGDRG